jgi:drug/metabolite transporter (DMT)-like permease
LSTDLKRSGEFYPFLKTYKAELILFAITFSWGLSFPLIKISLNFISPFFFLFIRFFITVLLFCFLFRKKIILTDYSKWKKGVILGIFLFSGFAFQTIGLKYTTASKSAFITGTAIVLIPFAQYFLLRSRPKAENITGGLIVLTGLYILSEAYITIPNPGDLLTLLGAVSFAVHIVLLNKYTTESNFNYLAFGQFLTMSVLSFIFMIIFEIIISDELIFIFNEILAVTIVYSSVIATLISIVLITKYQQETTPLRAGIIYSMESVFAVFFAFIIIGEILNFNQMIGALIMISGLIISEFYGFFKYKYFNAGKS